MTNEPTIPLRDKLETMLQLLKLNTLSELLTLATRAALSFARKNNRKGLAFRDEAVAEAWYILCTLDFEKLKTSEEPEKYVRMRIGHQLLKYFMRWKQQTVHDAEAAGMFVPQVFGDWAFKYAKEGEDPLAYHLALTNVIKDDTDWAVYEQLTSNKSHEEAAQALGMSPKRYKKRRLMLKRRIKQEIKDVK